MEPFVDHLFLNLKVYQVKTESPEPFSVIYYAECFIAPPCSFKCSDALLNGRGTLLAGPF